MWVLVSMIYGAIFASFLTLVGERVPEGRSVVSPASSCDSCGTTLRGLDLVPIGSYIWNRGKCRHCGVSYGSFHMWMEIGVALGFGLVVYVHGDEWWYMLLMMVTLLLWVPYAVGVVVRGYRLDGFYVAYLFLLGVSVLWTYSIGLIIGFITLIGVLERFKHGKGIVWVGFLFWIVVVCL